MSFKHTHSVLVGEGAQPQLSPLLVEAQPLGKKVKHVNLNNSALSEKVKYVNLNNSSLGICFTDMRTYVPVKI